MSAIKMPPHMKVWVYQANRLLNSSEKELIKKETEEFLSTWTAHNEKLLASCELKYDLFLILMVDEEQTKASGCSIDKSVHFIHSLEKKFNLNFMNRMLFAYKADDVVKVISRDDFRDLIANGTITDETIVFNNLVSTLHELEEQWEIPLKQSWHKQLV